MTPDQETTQGQKPDQDSDMTPEGNMSSNRDTNPDHDPTRRPPLLARALLRLLPDEAREFVMGDLEEEYRDRQLPEGGRVRAGLWYWGQTLATLLAFLGFRSSERNLRPQPSGAWPLRFDAAAMDLRLAFRNLWRRPGFTATAVLTLGLGIGTCATMFSAFDAAFFRPLPLESPERLLRVWIGNRETGYTTNPFTIRDYLDWRERTDAVDFGIYRARGLNVTLGDRTEWRIGIQGSANLISILGITPSLGRGFLPEEEWDRSERIVVLAPSFWEEEFGRDPGAVGRTLILDGEPHIIVGILPTGMRLPQFSADFWIPLRMTGTEPRSGHAWWGVARMKPGITLPQARADLQAAAQAVAADDPSQRFPDATLVPFREAIYGTDVVQISVAFGTAVLFVLLIACANIANLLLARGVERKHELAVRNAMGGGRMRILRHLLCEVLILALAGGVVGVLMAGVGIRLMEAHIIPPGDVRISMDQRVLVACLILTLAAAFLFGLLPAVTTSKVDLRARLQGGMRGVLGGKGQRLARLLVIGQVAMVLALLTSAGLMTKSLVVLNQVDLGFRTEGLMTFRVSPPPSRYPEGSDLRAFHDQFRDRLQAMPGIRRVGLNDNAPVGFGNSTGFTIPGREDGEADTHRSTQVRVVDAGLREVMEMELLAGRWFDEVLDSPEAPSAVVVSRTLAEALWGGPNAALGQSMEAYEDAGRVVGVVEAGRMLGPHEGPPFVLFLPVSQHPRRMFTYLVDAALESSTLIPMIRQVLQEIDPSVALQQPATVEDQLGEIQSPQHISLTLFLVFGSLAMVLTFVGVFGVVSHEVTRRRPEMGLRLALGSAPGGLIRHVLLRNGRTAALGVLLGSGLSLIFGRLIASLFVGVETMELDILMAVVALTILAMAAATYVPARKASRVDPVKTLTGE